MFSDVLANDVQSFAAEFPVEQPGDSLRWRIGRDRRTGVESPYFIESSCGLYSVCDVVVGGRKTVEAWGRAKRGGATVQLAVGLCTRAEGVRVCEAHANGWRIDFTLCREERRRLAR